MAIRTLNKEALAGTVGGALPKPGKMVKAEEHKLLSKSGYCPCGQP